MTTYGELMEQAKALQLQAQALERQAVKLRKAEAAEVIAEIWAMMRKHGVSLQDVVDGRVHQKSPGTPKAATVKTRKPRRAMVPMGLLPTQLVYREPIAVEAQL